MIHDRIALITGAGTGIGRGIARAFAAAHYAVLACDLDRALLDETISLIAEEGGNATPIVADLSTQEGARSAVGEGMKVHSRLDVLVCNAAIFPHSTLDEVTEELLDRVFALNVKSVFWMLQAALPALESSGSGRLLITSSLGGNRTVTPGLLAYETAKSSLGGMIRNLAVELGPRGITVNAVQPGLIKTERVSERFTDDGFAAMARVIPMRRCGTPADIGNAMVFLASPESSYVTGQSLAVGGGVELIDGLSSNAFRN